MTTSEQSSGTQSQVTVHMFVGCQINSELRMHLRYSESWQQKQVLPSSQLENLRQMSHDGKEYVGTLLKRSSLTLDELRTVEGQIREAIAEHCPELEIAKADVCVFPQLFLS